MAGGQAAGRRAGSGSASSRPASRDTRSPTRRTRSRAGAASRIPRSMRRRQSSCVRVRAAMDAAIVGRGRGPRPRTGTIDAMEGFGFFNDPDFQKRLGEMAEQMQSAQSLAWADNAIKLAVDMTVAAIGRINVQGTTEQQSEQIRSTMVKIFSEAVTLVSEARRA